MFRSGFLILNLPVPLYTKLSRVHLVKGKTCHHYKQCLLYGGPERQNITNNTNKWVKYSNIWQNSFLKWNCVFIHHLVIVFWFVIVIHLIILSFASWAHYKFGLNMLATTLIFIQIIILLYLVIYFYRTPHDYSLYIFVHPAAELDLCFRYHII